MHPFQHREGISARKHEAYKGNYKAREKNKPKDLSYKLILNCYYGLSSSPVFKSVYNYKGASDCTSMVRTWMKKLAQKLELNGMQPIYGFTDGIYVLLPEHLDKEDLMIIVNNFIEEAKSHTPFPMNSFLMDIEEEIKMMWFVAKNCYLYITQDDKVKYKSTLLNTNTPKSIMKLFDDYMKPKMIKELNVNFTYKELEEQMKLILEKDITLAPTEWKVESKESYKVQTSMQYQISERYGEGRHLLIPNSAGIGVGKQKDTKKARGIRHCSLEEFEDNKLTIKDIELKQLLSHLKPFYLRNEEEGKDSEQTTLSLENKDYLDNVRKKNTV